MAETLLVAQGNPWQQILDWIRAQELLDEKDLKNWLERLKFTSFNGAVLSLSAPSEWYCQQLRRRFEQVIINAGAQLFKDFVSVEFFASEPVVPVRVGLINASLRQVELIEPETPEIKVLNRPFRRGRFKTIVKYPGNQMAVAALGQVINNLRAGKSSSYPLIYLWGKPGLGKTHLLEAVFNFLSKDARLKVVLITAENFLNEMVAANFQKQQVDFRLRFRDANVFLLDEADFANRSRAGLQAELKQTLEALCQSNAQVIIASGLSPNEMGDHNSELISRYRGGLIIKIDSPDLEARQKIVCSLAKRKGIDLPEAVASLLAKSVNEDIRELVGAVTKVLALNELLKLPINEETAALAVESLASNKKTMLSVKRIIEETAGHFGLSAADLKGARRTRQIVYPRQIAMFLCFKLLKVKLTEIAAAFNKKDHTSVIYSCKAIESDLHAQEDWTQIEKKLGL